MNRNLWLSLVSMAALALAGCSWEAPVEEEQPPPVEEEAVSQPLEGGYVFTPDNYPRMGGSLAALPLGQAVTAAALGIGREQTDEYIQFENSTTWNYQQLVDGNFDILLAYEPSGEALEYAEQAGFSWEMTPIGRDALVFIANAANPVEGLTTQQIADIYTGQLTKWSELGGADREIIAYQRNQDSGSQTLFDLFFPLGERLMKPPSDQVVGSMIGLLEVVADYDNSADALGYTVYYYLSNMETDKLSRTKILSVDGVAPDNAAIASGQYPYTNDFYVVIPAGLAEDDPARVLYNWICSDQVRELGERENYVMLQ